VRRPRGLSNNGTVNGDSGLKTAGLPPLAVRMLLKPAVWLRRTPGGLRLVAF